MKPAWAAAAAAVGALAVGIGLADGWGSGSTVEVAHVIGTATSAPAVWRANADGSHPRLLGRGSQPLLAPDGSLLAASSGRGLTLYAVFGADGSGAVQITNDGRNLNPVWGRGGIAFDHERLRADAEPAYQLWLMASDEGARRPLRALAIPPVREGLVPIGFSEDGSLLLAESEGQDTSEAWLLTLSRGRATSLGADLVGAAMSRNHASALVDRSGFLNAPDEGVVESLPLAGGQPLELAADGSEPSWNA